MRFRWLLSFFICKTIFGLGWLWVHPPTFVQYLFGNAQRLQHTSTCWSTTSDLPVTDWIDPQDLRFHSQSLVVVHKSGRRLMHFSNGRSDACWPIGLGFSPRGAKQVEGDGKTPEGWYHLTDKPESQYQNALSIHYPNGKDALRGLHNQQITKQEYQQIKRGEEDKQRYEFTALGGLLLIHGGGAALDRTLGCVAMDDEDLHALRNLLPESMESTILLLP